MFIPSTAVANTKKFLCHSPAKRTALVITWNAFFFFLNDLVFSIKHLIEHMYAPSLSYTKCNCLYNKYREGASDRGREIELGSHSEVRKRERESSLPGLSSELYLQQVRTSVVPWGGDCHSIFEKEVRISVVL